MKDFFANKNVIEYFHACDSEESWGDFMRFVRYGIKRCFGNLDELTISLPQWNGKTLLEMLNEHGAAGFNQGGLDGSGVAVDLEFGARVYVSVWWPEVLA